MALMVLTATYVSVTGAGTIADHTTKAELTAEIEEKDVTTFASLGWKEVTGGLKSGSLALTLLNDFVDDGLDEDWWTLYLAGVPTAFEVRSTQSAVSTSNPKYTGNVLVNKASPLNGSVGDVNTFDVTLPTSGAITRATS